MKIRKLFKSPNTLMNMTVEMPDGRMMMFNASPFRKLEESDLQPAPGYQAIGKCAEEAPEYMYGVYGLEKMEG